MRKQVARVITAVVIAGAVSVACVLPAQAVENLKNLRKYAGIVLDAKTGDILYQVHADDERYPASISKVMTLYILFQELAAGHITLDTKFTVSPWAASASPTKLGLKAGSKIRVEDIIKSIVTISANDMARTIAENIAGSEPAFARRMTATAHALGMNHTQYVNASGLPDARQLTTVHDQALLASAVYEHFPQYYHFFQTRSFAYGKRVYGNHDNVLGFQGVDGMKTGYINAAGYNLMTATRKGDRHLVVVGFGFNTGGERDAMVRSLVAKYLPKAHAGQYLASAMIRLPGRQRPTTMLASLDGDAGTTDDAAAKTVKPAPVPTFRKDDNASIIPAAYDSDPVAYADDPEARHTADPVTGADGTPLPMEGRPALAAVSAIGDASSSRQSARQDVVGESLNHMLLGAPPAALGQTRASAPLLPPVGIGDKNQAIDLFSSGSISSHQVAEAALEVESEVLGLKKSEPTPARVAEAATPAPGGWIVQIGAAPTEEGAHGLLSDATRQIRTLHDLRPYVERFDKNGQAFYRARFVGFGNRNEASDVCGQLKKAKMTCLAMQG
ncbi:MAG TPA: serine hydrolase [Devosiaceae bacterium]|nr:serine hydrolase [Devosiaceae bacterium]